MVIMEKRLAEEEPTACTNHASMHCSQYAWAHGNIMDALRSIHITHSSSSLVELSSNTASILQTRLTFYINVSACCHALLNHESKMMPVKVYFLNGHLMHCSNYNINKILQLAAVTFCYLKL